MYGRHLVAGFGSFAALTCAAFAVMIAFSKRVAARGDGDAYWLAYEHRMRPRIFVSALALTAASMAVAFAALLTGNGYWAGFASLPLVLSIGLVVTYWGRVP